MAELIQFECGFLSENSKVMSPKFFYAFVKLCQKCPVLLCIASLLSKLSHMLNLPLSKISCKFVHKTLNNPANKHINKEKQ